MHHRGLHRLFLCALLTLPLLACGGGPGIGSPCSSTSDCAAGDICVDGLCASGPDSGGSDGGDGTMDGGVRVDSGATPGGDSGTTGSDAGDVDAACGGEAVAFTYTPPNALVILDRSCSMRRRLDETSLFGTGPNDSRTRWAVARDAVNALVSEHESRVNWGLMAFPDSREGCGMPVSAEVVPGPRNASTIASELQRNGIQPFGLCGLDNSDSTTQPRVTPIGHALTAARALPALSATDRRNFAILVADGGENCGSNISALRDLAQGLNGAGIPVAVIGFATGADEASLEAVASTGGFPNPAGPPSYFAAESSADLDTIFEEISRRVISCDLELSSTPADGVGVFVNVNDVALGEDPTDGFTYDRSGNVVHFHGTTCARLRSGEITRIGVAFGCPVPECQPVNEVCNGLDDDCDGVVDNDCLT